MVLQEVPRGGCRARVELTATVANDGGGGCSRRGLRWWRGPVGVQPDPGLFTAGPINYDFEIIVDKPGLRLGCARTCRADHFGEMSIGRSRRPPLGGWGRTVTCFNCTLAKVSQKLADFGTGGLHSEGCANFSLGAGSATTRVSSPRTGQPAPSSCWWLRTLSIVAMFQVGSYPGLRPAGHRVEPEKNPSCAGR